jgi:hypothetical protein
MPELTLITHVYNGQPMLSEQLARWRAYAPALADRLEFLVIDDCSDPVLHAQAQGLNLRLLRVTDDIAWNMPGCRNLAAIQARSDWLLYFDVDQFTAEANILMMVNALPKLSQQRLYVFRRIVDGVDAEPHINTFLISRRGFFRAGGYDEDFAGHYGFEDVVFRNMWRRHVGDEVLLTNIAFDQGGRPTSGLSRDTQRNQALAQYKMALGFPKPRGCLRFQWEEVEGAAAP